MGVVAPARPVEVTPWILSSYTTSIDTALRQSALSPSSLIGRMTGYHLGWCDEQGIAINGSSGKFLRSSLCLWSCAACGADPAAAMPAAVAIELVHNFTLIHDDIQDGDRLRRNRPTVWSVWGQGQAINAGDGLYALAFRVLTDSEQDPPRTTAIVGVISEALLTVIRGQCLDLSLEGRVDTSLLTYLRLIRLKTAELFGAAMEAGAISAGANGGTRAAFRRAGRLLGLAFQLRDDWLGVWGRSDLTGKSNESDLARRKLTYPVVAAYARATPFERQELRRIYADRSAQSAIAMRSLLDELGGPNLTIEAPRRPAHRAVRALDDHAPHPSARKEFADVADYVAQRNK